MATMTTTETLASKTEIKEAMSVLRLDPWADDLIDEIELDRRLSHSLEQANRGETFPIEQLKKQEMEKIANGYYDR
ncbi:MAG: hypothetical protein LBU89_13945 [Fibromonadaceae bacterium]|jgi:CMP-N-acetylneuraminic acid synthetase|nr:hypothetical protein [Fibromonadaceae bacterium]